MRGMLVIIAIIAIVVILNIFRVLRGVALAVFFGYCGCLKLLVSGF